MLIVLVLCTLFAGTALAQAPTTKQVGLVIAFPDGTEHLEIVTVPTAATTFDVLQKAKITLASADSGFGPARVRHQQRRLPGNELLLRCRPLLGLL